jgi:DNA-binding SARP family transcriptional activator
MTHLSLWLLGPFLAESDGERLSGFRSDKVRALLAYLCVECHRPWSRATLAYLLWPDLPEKNAQSNLRNALSNLRHVLGDRQADPPYLHISPATLQFNNAGDYWLDVRAFLDLLPKVGPDEDLLSDQAEIARLEQALALYRGDFLEGFAVASAPFEEWTLVMREHLRQKRLQAVRLLAMVHARSGDLEASSEYTERWLQIEPWEEAAHRHMMQLLALRGRRGAALAQYEACRRALSEELGIEPEAETAGLYEQIRDGLPDTPFAILPPPAEWPGLERRVPHWLPEFLTGEPTVAGEPILFVDREPELGTLAAALARAAAGQGAVHFVTGEPGSGKTALLAEFARRALARDPELLVAWGQCNAFTGEGDPYYPFLNIIRMLAGDAQVPGPVNGISPEQTRRLWQRLPATLDALLDHGPDLINRFVSGRELLALAQLHSGVRLAQLKRLQRLVQHLEEQPALPRVQQAALFEQFTRVLCALAQRGPLLLLVDDMQWIDPGSASLLFHLARRMAGSKVLLLGAYRPEEASPRREAEPHPLAGVVGELQRAFGDIQVDLMQSEGEAFVAAFVDSEPNELDRTFRATLYRHTSGNPLFTVELLRGMQLRGEIQRDRQGRWVEGPQLNWNKLPARAEAVIASRIRHVSPACRGLLSVASVEGEQFTAEVMADVLQQDVRQVCDLLSQEAGKQYRLVSAQALRQVGGQNLALYHFRHALFQTYLYQQLDVVERARLHGLVACKLEELHAGNLDQFPEMPHALARHFEVAGLADKAVPYYTWAGKNALCLSANREAVAHFYSALRLLQALPATPERDRRELDLQLSLGPPLTATKGWAPPELAAAYARAQDLCESTDDHAQLIPALWLLATYRIGRSEHAEADKLSQRLFRLAQQAGDPALLALASLQVSPFYQGKFAEARRLLAPCRTSSRSAPWRCNTA